MAGAPVIDVQVAAGMPFAEAAEAFGSRVPVLTPSVLNSAREFWLSQRAIAAAPVRRTLTKMAQDYLQRYMSGGADSRKGFTQWLSEQNVGITDHYAETVRRAALGNSFSEGRLKQMREHNDRVRSLGGADDVVGFRLMSAGDAAVRPEHAALDGIAFPLTQAGLRFMPPNGFGCFLPGTEVSGAFDGATRAFYVGESIEVRTRKGRGLSVTPNHPIATDRGWVAAKDLRQGDNLVCYRGDVDAVGAGSGNDAIASPLVSREGVHHNDVPAVIEDVFDAVSAHGARSVAPGRGPLDFHGDARCFESDVDVAILNGVLKRAGDPAGLDGVEELVDHELGRSGLPGDPLGAVPSLSRGNLSPLGRLPSSAALGGDSVAPAGLDLLPLEALSFGSAAGLNTMVSEHSVDRGAGYAEFLRELQDAGSGSIELDEVCLVHTDSFAGHVYDLQSVSSQSAGHGWMVANGIVSSNCRCTYAPVFADEGADLATDAEMATLERFVDDGWLNAPSSIMEKRASLASRSGRVKLADDPPGTRWITVGGGEGSEGGGRRVQIDGQGRVLKGLSKGAEGKTLDEAFSDTGAAFGNNEGGSTPTLNDRYKKLVRDASSGPYRIAYEGNAVSTDGWREEMASARSKRQAAGVAKRLVEERGGGSLEMSAIGDAETFSDTKREFVDEVIERVGRASEKRKDSERKLGHLKELMGAGADIDMSSRSEATYVTLPLGEGNYARIRFADHPAVWESSKFAVQVPYEDLWSMSPSEIKELAQSAPAYAISDLSPADVEDALKEFGDQDTNEKAAARGRLLSSRSGPLNSKLSSLLHRMRLTAEETR